MQLGPAMLICSSVLFSIDRIEDIGVILFCGLTMKLQKSNIMLNQTKRLEWANLFERVRICWFFSQHTEPTTLAQLQLTAKSFGETENLCITRLVALHRIQSYKDEEGFGKMALDFEKELCSAFGYQINSELLQVYLAFEFGRLWHETIDPGNISD